MLILLIIIAWGTNFKKDDIFQVAQPHSGAWNRCKRILSKDMKCRHLNRAHGVWIPSFPKAQMLRGYGSISIVPVDEIDFPLFACKISFSHPRTREVMIDTGLCLMIQEP